MFNHISVLKIYEHSLPDGWVLNEERDNWPKNPIIDGIPYTLSDLNGGHAVYVIDIESFLSQTAALKAQVAGLQEDLRRVVNTDLDYESPATEAALAKCELQNQELKHAAKRAEAKVDGLEHALERWNELSKRIDKEAPDHCKFETGARGYEVIDNYLRYLKTTHDNLREIDKHQVIDIANLETQLLEAKVRIARMHAALENIYNETLTVEVDEYTQSLINDINRWALAALPDLGDKG